jgi:PAS domain S-box-containing protein
VASARPLRQTPFVQRGDERHRSPVVERLLSLTLVAEAFENLTIGVFVTDSELRFLAANAAALELSGYTREELLALSAEDVVLRSRDALLEIGRRAEREPHAARIGIRRKDGSTVEIDTLTLPSKISALPVILTLCEAAASGPLAAVATAGSGAGDDGVA